MVVVVTTWEIEEVIQEKRRTMTRQRGENGRCIFPLFMAFFARKEMRRVGEGEDRC